MLWFKAKAHTTGKRPIGKELTRRLGICMEGQGCKIDQRTALSACRLVALACLSLLMTVGCSTVPWAASSQVVVEWTTASEINTAGFNLYRSDSKAGPFDKVNDQLIPASSDPVAGASYRYEDGNVAAGQTYYYELEDVEFNGAAARHGPIAITAPSSTVVGGELAVSATAGCVLLASATALLVRRRVNRRKNE